jgi:dienelactone hydrolase
MILLNDLSRQYKHIVIGGFSMGGGLVLHLMRYCLPLNIRGIFSIGSFVIKSSLLNTINIRPENKNIP